MSWKQRMILAGDSMGKETYPYGKLRVLLKKNTNYK